MAGYPLPLLPSSPPAQTPSVPLGATVACLALALVGALATCVAFPESLAAHYSVPAVHSFRSTVGGLRPPPSTLPWVPRDAASMQAPPLSSSLRRALWSHSQAVVRLGRDAPEPQELEAIEDAADGDLTLSSLVAAVGYCWVLLGSAWMRLRGIPDRISSDRTFSSSQPVLDCSEGNLDGNNVPVQSEGVTYERFEAGDAADPMVVHMCSYHGKRHGSLGGKFIHDILSLHPAYLVGLTNIISTALLRRFPAYYQLFIARGLGNPLGFLLSGFSCVNPIALVGEVFFFHIITRNYVSEWTWEEFTTLYLGGTIGAALLVMLQGTAYMGPTGGSTALLTAYALRNQTELKTLWPFVHFKLPLQTIGIAATAINVWLLVDGAASGAAFVGGVLFAVFHWRCWKSSKGLPGRSRR